MKISIIGAGNLAWFLGHEWKRNGHTIIEIVSRKEAASRALARELDAKWSTEPGRCSEDSDLYLLAVSDNAIANVSESLPQVGGLVVHGSGSTDINTLGKHKRRGVMYYFQTFTKGRKMAFNHIPVCIEAARKEDLEKLDELAGQSSAKIVYLNTLQRQYLHLAGVFANNFSNHIIKQAFDLLKKQNLEPSLLNALMSETLQKAFDISPAKAQTGPAIRGDNKTMATHVEMLKDQPEIQKLYTFVSTSIQKSNE